MRAAVISNKSLTVEERPDPIAGTGELLIAVRAAGLNNADLMQIAGFYPAPPGSPADIPGLEFAGEVGDRVMGVVGGGALATMLTVHERTVIPVPPSVSWEAAGGFPEAFTTAHDAIFTQCRLSAGERICVHGAAGGVGVAAVQLAAAAGAFVVATVRDPQRRTAVEALAPGRIVAVDPADVAEHGPFDVVLELIGASNMATNISSLSLGGRISIIGVGGGGGKGEVDLLALMGKRGSIHASTLRSRPLEQKAAAAALLEKASLRLLADGVLQVPILASYPLNQVADAYDRFRSGSKFGKIIVTC
jgi:NADPH:quinone reductase